MLPNKDDMMLFRILLCTFLLPEEERNNKPVLPAERLRQEIKEIRVKYVPINI